MRLYEHFIKPTYKNFQTCLSIIFVLKIILQFGNVKLLKIIAYFEDNVG